MKETQPFYFTMYWRLGGGGQSISLSGVILLQIIKSGRFLCLHPLTLRFTSKISGKDAEHKAGIQIKVPWVSKPLSICNSEGFPAQKVQLRVLSFKKNFPGEGSNSTYQERTQLQMWWGLKSATIKQKGKHFWKPLSSWLLQDQRAKYFVILLWLWWSTSSDCWITTFKVP